MVTKATLEWCNTRTCALCPECVLEALVGVDGGRRLHVSAYTAHLDAHCPRLVLRMSSVYTICRQCAHMPVACRRRPSREEAVNVPEGLPVAQMPVQDAPAVRPDVPEQLAVPDVQVPKQQSEQGDGWELTEDVPCAVVGARNDPSGSSGLAVDVQRGSGYGSSNDVPSGASGNRAKASGIGSASSRARDAGEVVLQRSPSTPTP